MLSNWASMSGWVKKRKTQVQLWMGCYQDERVDCVPGALSGNGWEAWQKFMRLRSIEDILHLRPWWNKSSRNAKASDTWTLLSEYCQKLWFIVLDIFEDVPRYMLYLIWILKGRMLTNEDKLPLQMQKDSFFHLDSLCFFFFPLLQLEKCSIMWNRSCSVQSSGHILKPHCSLVWHVAYFRGGVGGITVHDFNNQILRDEYKMWSSRKNSKLCSHSPFPPFPPYPAEHEGFQVTFLELLPKLLYEILTHLK